MNSAQLSVTVSRPNSRRWTILGLAIASAAMPIVLALFNRLRLPWTTTNILLREAVLFGIAGGLLLLIRQGEGLGWESVGLQRPALVKTALWVLITLILLIIAAALAFGMIKLLGWPVGRNSAHSYDLLPTWVVAIVILRAGFIEELYYRGYMIERLQMLTGSRLVAAGLPLFVFAICHYEQGWAGITIALFTGAVLSGAYMYKRNLWITIIAHFLVDFIPNIVVPLLSCLSWKWRKRSSVKIAERTYEKGTKALHRRGEGGHSEAAPIGQGSGLGLV